MLTPQDVQVTTLGERKIRSPLNLSHVAGDGRGMFVPDAARVRFRVEVVPGEAEGDEILFEKAGPRDRLFFDPARVRAAIVTCGGLCPGLNNVIRSAFLELYHNYGVKEILGIRYGYQGLDPVHGQPPVRLTPEFVDSIQREGGTVLGSSRGPVPPATMVDTLKRERIDLLFCVGGDGTQRGAQAIHEEVRRRGRRIAVVGIPKTIDNDLMYVWRSFGFFTAIEKAREVIDSAHLEARGAPNGIGLVKLMGRHVGFIAAGATLASQEVNFALIPEVPFALEGEDGFLIALERRIVARGHAVVVVAEGAGQDLMGPHPVDRDASGNMKLQDIGVFLREQIAAWFAARGIATNMKYLDPSYIIRSVPANCDDSLLCDQLARHAVHAAMAGKTDLLVGNWNNHFVHVPIATAVAQKRQLSPESEVWMSVLAVTGQPARFGKAPLPIPAAAGSSI
jgi:6-phosphofructokinase 1